MSWQRGSTYKGSTIDVQQEEDKRWMFQIANKDGKNVRVGGFETKEKAIHRAKKFIDEDKGHGVNWLRQMGF